jgi:chloramphenicol-sensitive protein RarD
MHSDRPAAKQTLLSLAAALGMYVMWGGVLPVYWRTIHGIPPLETLAHRIFWGGMLLLVTVRPKGIYQALMALAKQPQRQRMALLGAAIIGSNWLIYILGVRQSRMMEASLGYYIGPLFSMLLGRLVLGEKLRASQKWAGALATVGVIHLVRQHGQLPWFGLALAGSFSAYSLVRKLSGLNGMQGFIVETAALLPSAALYIAYLALTGQSQFWGATPLSRGLLMGSGLMGSIPIVLFGVAAQGLPLTTLGLLQYLAPTIGLGMAIWRFGEPLTPTLWFTFGCIWTGLALWGLDSLWIVNRRAASLLQK